MDRLVIEISGDLPDEGKFAVMASAEEAVAALVGGMTSIDLKASVRVVRGKEKSPGLKVAAE